MAASDARPWWQSKLLESWTRHGWVSCALWPVSLVFRLVVALRWALYRSGVLKSTRLPVPVVVIGNVVVGGGGKTPLVIALAEHLRKRGVAAGVVSRGYGRRSAAVCPVLHDSDATEVGDEPLLIRRRAEVPVWVGGDRVEAGRALLQASPETQVILCDDGLQNHSLERDLELCVFGARSVGNGLMLPAGPLREPWPPRDRTDRAPRLLLYSGEAQPPGKAAFPMIRTLAPDLIRADGTRTPLTALDGDRTAVVAAIADPGAFFAMLEAAGLKPAWRCALADHDRLEILPRAPSGITDWICTEKDATKLWAAHPYVWAARLDLRLDANFLTAFDTEMDRLGLVRPVSSHHGYSTA